VPKILDVFIQTAHALKPCTRSSRALRSQAQQTSRDHAGEVKVIDLGQACLVGTAKSDFQGTPDTSRRSSMKCLPSTRVRVFNFGATMYWTLTTASCPAFHGEDQRERFLVDDQIVTPVMVNKTCRKPCRIS